MFKRIPRAVFYAPSMLIASVLMRFATGEEEEVASLKDCAMAGTLLGAVSFQMTLFYFLNHSDPDMRKYSYEVVSSTISIFCAVLMFQSINGVVEAHMLEGATMEHQLVVDFAMMLIWFVFMQILLAFFSGSLPCVSKPTNEDEMESDMKCWAVLVAHMTGFASINAFGTMQQLPLFSSTPGMAFVPVPIACLVLLCLQRITDMFREKIAAGDGEKDEYEHCWDEETEEAENDVMGLSLSFLLVQAVRFTISGSLPNQEGEEEGAIALSHGTHQVLALLGCGVVFVTAMGYSIYRSPTKEALAEAGREDVELEEGEMSETMERFLDVVTVAMSMTFAWCVFFSGRWYFSTVHFFEDDPMMLALGLALILSGGCFSMIRVLDLIADADWTGAKVDAAIVQVIGAMGILVGFSWEQCFDAAVGSLASRSDNPSMTKLALAVMSFVVIVPAWRWHLLPFVVHHGYTKDPADRITHVDHKNPEESLHVALEKAREDYKKVEVKKVAAQAKKDEKRSKQKEGYTALHEHGEKA